MTTIRTGRTGHIAWRQHGENPQILLLHGFTDSGACWNPVIPGLGGRSVVTTDARGHGESGLPEEPFDSTDQAADAASVIEDLGLRDVVVMGHSMGGATAVSLAAARPDLVSALILEDPAVRSGAMRRGPQPSESFLAMKAMSDEERIEKCRADNPAWSDEELIPRCEALGQFNLDVYQRRSNNADSRPTYETLRSLSLPVLLLHGDADRGSIVDQELLPTLGENIRALHIPGVGHSIRRENQPAFLAAVNEFLTERLG
ncbi:MAG TPA: alpha/beta hydrolase [Mycobacteriales bacterium]|nr:alpha/beta hydrolase [Mycobacteriales bacterium]